MNHPAVYMLVISEIVKADYTCIQLIEMVIIYGKCQRNIIKAAKVYSKRVPKDSHPMHEPITDALYRIRDTCCHGIEQKDGQGLTIE